MKMTEKTMVLELKNIRKSFGDTEVLRDISLAVAEGEFVTLLGSSGCGKTTLLRIIAGLEAPDSGRVLLEGKDMEQKPPEKRNVNMVFQNYALFPHMNVAQNIGYGLKIRGAAKDEIKRRVSEMLSLVQLEGYELRKPAAMSGGQRQRVAIARALINNPKVLLLDEPLGALDLQLRRQMQLELKRLQKALGITFIYITHDQEEAINMSDRIVVLREGKIEQVGTPAEIYDMPRTSYVAGFVGAANVLSGTLEQPGKEPLILSAPFGRMNCCVPSVFQREFEKKMQEKTAERNENPDALLKLTLAVRSERIEIYRKPESEVFIEGEITEKNFAGGMLRVTVRLCDGTEVILSRHGIDIAYELGEQVYLEWPPEAAVLVEHDMEKHEKNGQNV